MKKEINILALILARGGSKGIPHKNILELAGKPLIAYSILQAKNSRYINRVIVSTDDKKIAVVANRCGAEVPFMRPVKYAGDTSSDIESFRHALKWLKEHQNYTPDLIVHLRPSHPVRKVTVIDRAIELLLGHPEADALRSVSPALQAPYKMWKMRKDGFLDPLLRIRGIKDCQSLPRQRLPYIYWQNGYIDIVRPRAILERNSMWGKRVLGFAIDEPIFELDYPENIPIVKDALRNSNRRSSQVKNRRIKRHPA